MTDLKNITPILKDIISIVSDTLQVESAVIDNQYNLVAYSDNYLKYKGKEVHGIFVQKVFEQGEIIVSEPGKMPICQGCRFQQNCPAITEMLSCIKIEDSPLGVISLSCFNTEGKTRFNNNFDVFEKTIKRISSLITDIIERDKRSYYMSNYKKIMQTAMDLTQDGIICVDNDGKIIDYNKSAQRQINSICLNGESIYDLKPFDKLVNMQEKLYSDLHVKINGKGFFVSGYPVKDPERFYGTILKLSSKDRSNEENDRSYEYLENIKGKSSEIILVKTKVEKISKSTSTVLIVGETGTGKELFAKAIHYCSKRKDKPFIAINCAAIPENLLESELFGYEEGAFTGAKRKGKIGVFEAANNGTIFLDEIGDMPVHLQVKLLRVLQERSIRRVGGNDTIPIDVRVISASNQNIEDLILKGKFREDLYYRINVIKLDLPPLRERKVDIPLLANNTLEKYNELMEKKIIGFTEDAIKLLQLYNWPGNVRELENVIEYAINMEEDDLIHSSSLPAKIRGKDQKDNSLNVQVEKLESAIIKEALDRYGYDLNGKKLVCKELEIGLRTLYRKLEKYEIC